MGFPTANRPAIGRMKKCRRCSKPATLHITEMREGGVHELHLCETCYQEYLDFSEDPEDPEDPEAHTTNLSIDACMHIPIKKPFG